jgi:Uncharacterized protein conserved in bacteria
MRLTALQPHCISDAHLSPSVPGKMVYADQMRFEPADLALLAESEEVEIETARPGGLPHRTIIWVVVDGDDTFIRSVNGSGARWYREAVADPAVTIHVAERGLPARAIPATDPSSIQRTSDVLASKYADNPDLASMLEPEIFDTTLKLVPA